MNNLVNIIIVLLIVGWLIGFIGFGAMVGNLIHILLILAVGAIVFRLVSGGKAKL
ncbi:MAG TPA: lmo0937 family membrane protein [Flavobacteriales bacterium]|nr:lmo0937 family membrane protein [Flavobacteriales bacterium]